MPSPSLSPGSAHAPLAIVTRGDAVDSAHFGSVAVVDGDGKLLFATGDPHFRVATRSALKPLQAMPFVAAGGVERFGYSQAQVALMCASHSGEPRHVDAVADMLRRAQCEPTQLQCGVHAPMFYSVRDETPPPGVKFTPLHHNCSGKHTGMLAYCRQCALPMESYLAFEHPLQQAIRKAVSHFTRVPEAELVAGIDGCSAPNYAVPLDRLAHAYARIAVGADDAIYGKAPATIGAAMSAHPEMVSGDGRIDLALMRASRGDWVTKIGAEGVQAIGIRSRGWGVAIKVADGNTRGLYPATVAALEQIGLLDDAARADLAPWREPQIRNYRGTVTGRVQAVVVMDRMG